MSEAEDILRMLEAGASDKDRQIAKAMGVVAPDEWEEGSPFSGGKSEDDTEREDRDVYSGDYKAGWNNMVDAITDILRTAPPEEVEDYVKMCRQIGYDKLEDHTDVEELERRAGKKPGSFRRADGLFHGTIDACDSYLAHGHVERHVR